MSAYGPCGTCGAVSDAFLVPVWEDMDDYDLRNPPDYIGCTECNTMNPYNA